MASDLLEERYNNLQEENDQCQKLNMQQKLHLAALHKEETVLKSKIQEKFKVPGGILAEQGKHRRDIQHIHILENQLNENTVRFDELMCSNMEDRKEIAHLLHQRGLFSNIQEKVNKQLATQKSITEKLEERVALFSKQRSEAQARMQEMRKRTQVETAKFLKRRAHLKTLITHETKLQTFMETKLQDIVIFEEDEESKNRKKQQQFENAVKKLEMYVQGHKTLLDTTGESDLRHIGLTFSQNEQKNFSYLRYVNELHNRRNMLRNQTETLKRDILSQEEENRGRDEQRNSHGQDLDLKLASSSRLSASLQQQRSEVQASLDRLVAGISGLFHDIMEEAVVVNFDNIVHLTGVLEERIVDLVEQINNKSHDQFGSSEL
ncbi:coiled-coil domain-containing protein 63-like [Clinocottus analis]|uniref:coiled-coil domain-containing protein 63-like n=1 Tax=Clinocottus analis TaxID=304258 RepID=UPI0035C13CDB